MLLVDSHVHIHQCYNLDEFFNNTFTNFSKFSKIIGNGKEWLGVLFFTEIKGVNYFKKLVEDTYKYIDNSKFTIQNTSEENSLILKNNFEQKIVIIAGKQIIAKSNIEVLALCTTKDIEQQQSLLKTVHAIKNNDGIVVLPWGVGKWTGKRKKIISNFLNEYSNESFFLGDNSGRPTFWNDPDIFEIGNNTNHFVLPGTDALALPSEINKTASYGFYLSTKVDLNKPTHSIKNALLNLDKQPQSFGNLENPIKFFVNQLKLQINKHFK